MCQVLDEAAGASTTMLCHVAVTRLPSKSKPKPKPKPKSKPTPQTTRVGSVELSPMANESSAEFAARIERAKGRQGTYTIENARYAKGKKIVRTPGDGTGLKTRAARLAQAKGIGGRWTNREKGYVMSPSAASRFEKLFREGWDANFMNDDLVPPETEPETETPVVGRADFEERKAARIARTKTRAAKAEAEAKAQYERSHAITSGIPMGQPILVGHHSEKRHRRDIKKSHAAMGKSVAATRQAETLKRRAASAESSHAISSDDPQALEKLDARIAQLEAERDQIKETSRLLRKGDPETTERFKRKYGRLSDAELRQGVPSYVLSNLGANIRRLRERRAQLAKSAVKPTRAPLARGDWTLSENQEINRVQLKGPRPDRAGKEILKRAGFRWAPSETAWQRQLNERGWYQGEQALGKLAPITAPPPPAVVPPASPSASTNASPIQELREHLDAWHRTTPGSDSRRKLGAIILRAFEKYPSLRDQFPAPLLKTIRLQSGDDQFAKMDRSYQFKLLEEIRSMLDGPRREYYQTADAVRAGARAHPAFRDASDATIDTARQRVLGERAARTASPSPSPTTAGGSLHQRIAGALGWPLEETHKFSLAALRDLVRPVNPALADEMSRSLQSGGHLVGSSAPPAATQPPTGPGSVIVDGRAQVAGAILKTQAAELLGGFRLKQYDPTEIVFEGVVGYKSPYSAHQSDSLRNLYIESRYTPGSGGYKDELAKRLADILKPGTTTTTNYVRVKIGGSFGRASSGIDPLTARVRLSFPKEIRASSARDLPGAAQLKGTKSALSKLASRPMQRATWTRGLEPNEAPKSLSVTVKSDVAPAPAGKGPQKSISIKQVDGSFQRVKGEVHGPVGIHSTGKHVFVVTDLGTGMAVSRFDSKAAALRLATWIGAHLDVYTRSVAAMTGGPADAQALDQVRKAIKEAK